METPRALNRSRRSNPCLCCLMDKEMRGQLLDNSVSNGGKAPRVLVSVRPIPSYNKRRAIDPSFIPTSDIIRFDASIAPLTRRVLLVDHADHARTHTRYRAGRAPGSDWSFTGRWSVCLLSASWIISRRAQLSCQLSVTCSSRRREQLVTQLTRTTRHGAAATATSNTGRRARPAPAPSPCPNPRGDFDARGRLCPDPAALNHDDDDAAAATALRRPLLLLAPAGR